MPTLFISDLHLSIERPEKLQLFRDLLARTRGRIEALYILGDLFEVWVGDDDDTAPYPDILAALRAFSDSGTPLRVMRGNRDFLIGESFERMTGCRLLPEPSVIDLDGERVLLMHGDLLCTNDHDYQAFRRKVREPFWQQGFLARPLWLRKGLGKLARLRSRVVSRGKPDYVMDVEAAAVEAAMQAHRVRVLIHGHTHRPAIHDLRLAGQGARRIVLGDWYEQDSVLVCDRGNLSLCRAGEVIDQFRP